MRLRLVLAAVALFGSAETALAQFNIQWKYTCAPGRFRISYSSKNPKSWHYCYDGNYYNEKTLPADLRAYFNKVDQDMKEAMDKFHKDWDESKQRSTEYWAKVDADRAARGLPTLASQREANLRWAAERHGRNVPGTTAGGGNRSMLLRSLPGPGGGVEASAKPEAEHLARRLAFAEAGQLYLLVEVAEAFGELGLDDISGNLGFDDALAAAGVFDSDVHFSHGKEVQFKGRGMLAVPRRISTLG